LHGHQVKNSIIHCVGEVIAVLRLGALFGEACSGADLVWCVFRVSGWIKEF